MRLLCRRMPRDSGSSPGPYTRRGTLRPVGSKPTDKDRYQGRSDPGRIRGHQNRVKASKKWRMYTREFDGTIISPRFGELRVRSLQPDDAPLLYCFFTGLSDPSTGWSRPHTYTLQGAARVVD